MNNNILRNKRGVVSLVGMLITLLIIAFLMYRLSRTHFAAKPRGDAGKALLEQGIDQSNPAGVVDAAKLKTDELNKQTREAQKQVEAVEDK